MGICQKHWDMLREEVKAQGLDEWVTKSGEVAVEQIVDQLKKGGEQTAVNYDPLMACHWMIQSRALEGFGLMAIQADFCPICELLQMWNPDGTCKCEREDCQAKEPGSIPDPEVDWIQGPVGASKAYMIEQGWIEA